MKTLFRLFALLAFFLANSALAYPGFSFDFYDTTNCYPTREELCSVTYPGWFVRYDPGYSAYICTSGVGGDFIQNVDCKRPTPTPSPSPTPKPNPCADKTDISSSIGSFSTADYHPSKKFICKSGCAYSGSMAYVFTTGDPIGSSSCKPINGNEPVNGCTYYGFQSIAGLGKTCDDAYQDYVAGVTSGLTITFDPNGTPPTPAPTSAPTSSPTPPGSGTPAPTAPPSTPAPTPLPPGKCKGTANGATVVYDCYNADKDTKTQETKNSDGSTTTSTTTKDTKCIGDACQTTTTTTTTTKDPNGNQVGSTTITGGTTTQTRKSFCEENPKAAACVGTPDEGFCEQNPQLSVCKDGKWGAGSCGSEPSCSGDEVQCAQARFAFKSYCESKKTSDLLQDLGEKFSADSNGGPGMPSDISFYTPSYPDGIAGVWASKKDQFNQTPLATLGARLLPDVGEGGQNPSFTFDLDFGGVMNMGTHTLEIDPNIWAIIRAIVLVSALIYAYKMIFGG